MIKTFYTECEGKYNYIKCLDKSTPDGDIVDIAVYDTKTKQLTIFIENCDRDTLPNWINNFIDTMEEYE